MLYNKLLCSDLKYISEHVPKGVVLTTGDKCLATIRKILNILFQYYIGNNHPLYVRVGIQWIPYAVLTFQLIYSIETPLWGLLYLFFWLTTFILSSFKYLVLVNYFNFTLALLWFWLVVGRLIFCVSLKLLSKPWGWVLIIGVMVQLYLNFNDFIYQLFAFLYILLVLVHVLFHLGKPLLDELLDYFD